MYIMYKSYLANKAPIFPCNLLFLLLHLMLWYHLIHFYSKPRLYLKILLVSSMVARFEGVRSPALTSTWQKACDTFSCFVHVWHNQRLSWSYLVAATIFHLPDFKPLLQPSYSTPLKSIFPKLKTFLFLPNVTLPSRGILYLHPIWIEPA